MATNCTNTQNGINLIGRSHSVDITRCLCPPLPCLATLILAVGSGLFALDHKITACLLAHWLKTTTNQTNTYLFHEIRPRGGGHSAHTHTGRGSVQEIFRQPKNITSVSLQPKNIRSFYTKKPLHEHKISRNNVNRSQDCLL